jgi:DNA-binding winged helix-turn-helix (wHTH) protein/predicted ATPase
VLTKRGFRFGRYRFDPTQGLTRGGQDVRVTPKSLAVLRVLLEEAGKIVTREELFRVVWRDTAVSEAALTTCIQELRRALADDARQPKYIETVHRRGFRFLAGAAAEHPALLEHAPGPLPSPAAGPIVGRDAALEQMSQALARARGGQRQMVFVTGEAGIGKTALVDALITGIDDRFACRVIRAECAEHHGAGEAYQPLLEALTRLCTQPESEPCLAALRQCAPTWLAQLPALQTQAERLALQRRAGGASPERMLRELTDALEMMTRRSTIVLCLEDLHWGDASTLDWVAAFARRPERAGVLLVGTYRPGEATSSSRTPEAVASGLGIKGLCTEIALSRLDAQAVNAYVMARFPPAHAAEPALANLATLVHQRTEGNPLFVVNALADLIARGVLVVRNGRWATSANLDATSVAIPPDVQRTIERQIDRLNDGERQVLEVASVIGGTCSVAAVAAGIGGSAREVEATLESLARRKAFVRECPPIEWPDGTFSATFEFLHSLYREVLSARLSPGLRADVHYVIGARLEAAYGERASELAAELARHFEHGRDFPRAVLYLQHAAETDRSRSANDVAQDHYRRALVLLDKLPAGDERDEREVALRIGLGSVLMQTSGWGAPEVEAVYARVRELSEARGPGQPLLSALWNLWIFHITRGDLDEARSLADRLFVLAGSSGGPESRLQAHHARWSTLFTLGDLHGTEKHAREGIRLCDAGRAMTLAYGSHDAAICARVFCARALALGGRTDAASFLCDEALTLARELEHPFTLAFTLMHVAAVHETRRDPSATRLHAAAAVDIAQEHGFGLMLAWATCLLGWSMAHLGDGRRGVTMLVDGLALARATGSALFQPHMLGLLASTQAGNGHVADALQTVEDALAVSARTGERFYVAEIYRLRGELRLAGDDDVKSRRLAEGDFRKAMRLAHDRYARQLTLRGAVSLARLWRRAGKRAEALQLVLDARSGVAEGEDLPDMVEAGALIAGDSTS